MVFILFCKSIGRICVYKKHIVFISVFSTLPKHRETVISLPVCISYFCSSYFPCVTLFIMLSALWNRVTDFGASFTATSNPIVINGTFAPYIFNNPKRFPHRQVYAVTDDEVAAAKAIHLTDASPNGNTIPTAKSSSTSSFAAHTRMNSEKSHIGETQKGAEGEASRLPPRASDFTDPQQPISSATSFAVSAATATPVPQLTPSPPVVTVIPSLPPADQYTHKYDHHPNVNYAAMSTMELLGYPSSQSQLSERQRTGNRQRLPMYHPWQQSDPLLSSEYDPFIPALLFMVTCTCVAYYTFFNLFVFTKQKRKRKKIPTPNVPKTVVAAV